MSMTVELGCAMCGKPKEVMMDTSILDANFTVAGIVKQSGWIWQQNDTNFDIYCSKKCAE